MLNTKHVKGNETGKSVVELLMYVSFIFTPFTQELLPVLNWHWVVDFLFYVLPLQAVDSFA